MKHPLEAHAWSKHKSVALVATLYLRLGDGQCDITQGGGWDLDVASMCGNEVSRALAKVSRAESTAGCRLVNIKICSWQNALGGVPVQGPLYLGQGYP